MDQYVIKNTTGLPKSFDILNQRTGQLEKKTLVPGEKIKVPADCAGPQLRSLVRTGILKLVEIDTDQKIQNPATEPTKVEIREVAVDRVVTKYISRGSVVKTSDRRPYLSGGEWRKEDDAEADCLVYYYNYDHYQSPEYTTRHESRPNAIQLPSGVPDGKTLILVNRTKDPVVASPPGGFLNGSEKALFADPDGQNAGAVMVLLSLGVLSGKQHWVIQSSTRLNNAKADSKE